MLSKFKLIVLLSASLAFSATPAIAALPNVANNSKWRITTFEDGNRTGWYVFCATFTEVNGLVNAVPTSGTWTSPEGWKGKWSKQGDRVSLFGNFGGNYAISLDGAFIAPNSMTGRFSVFSVPENATGFPESFGSWSAAPC